MNRFWYDQETINRVMVDEHVGTVKSVLIVSGLYMSGIFYILLMIKGLSFIGLALGVK